jgi:hypothetical protein
VLPERRKAIAVVGVGEEDLEVQKTGGDVGVTILKVSCEITLRRRMKLSWKPLKYSTPAVASAGPATAKCMVVTRNVPSARLKPDVDAIGAERRFAMRPVIAGNDWDRPLVKEAAPLRLEAISARAVS